MKHSFEKIYLLIILFLIQLNYSKKILLIISLCYQFLNAIKIKKKKISEVI